MAIGDKAYRDLVPEEAREAVSDQGLSELNQFSFGPDLQPYYPRSVRSVFQKGVQAHVDRTGASAAVSGRVQPPKR
jgi:hypothetical protein